MRAPPKKVSTPKPTVHKRIGRAGQLVLVRELPRGHVRDPQYRAERDAPPVTGLLSGGRATYEATGDTIEEAVDAACGVGG